MPPVSDVPTLAVGDCHYDAHDDKNSDTYTGSQYSVVDGWVTLLGELTKVDTGQEMKLSVLFLTLVGLPVDEVNLGLLDPLNHIHLLAGTLENVTTQVHGQRVLVSVKISKESTLYDTDVIMVQLQ